MAAVIPWHQLPNLLTVLRILAALPVFWLTWQQSFGWALLLFVIAGVSDGIDGALARRFGWTSRFGSVVDPISDKSLMIAMFLGLWLTQIIPGWLLVVIITRDLLIVGGAVSYHLLFGPYKMRPSVLGKAFTFSQLLFVISVMGPPVAGIDNGDMLHILNWLIVFMALASGLEYVYTWSRKALAAKSADKDKQEQQGDSS